MPVRKITTAAAMMPQNALANPNCTASEPPIAWSARYAMPPSAAEATAYSDQVRKLLGA